ncbi:hypothetical protein [Gordonia sp. KTR9]|uniref:hypothetical protein n=1 Tax=Gordonia sp. KTR9 TaxID=337191 RepID=UPI0001DD9694|nr:hypothetical protein [Gordonia sp. KTR9]ADK69022.1 hypothetical protein KTR9_4941 [Gordonia sp. KTR9]
MSTPNVLTVNDLEITPTYVLSYGLGEDSTAILLRWLEDPSSRDFDLADLAVVTAMTGNEWESTRAAVETHILPRMAAAGVRFIQVGRARRHVTKAGEGVVVLDDSRHPTRLYLEGGYSLWSEMTEAGTIPQSGGARMCSVHSKGDALDPVIAAITRGQPYRHVIGFEAGEVRRADKDRSYNTAVRTGEYPLIDWGWYRADAVNYTVSVVGDSVGKSACTFCPFSFGSKAGREHMLERYRAEPAVAARALLMEHLALALNPKQGLIGGKRLIDLIRAENMTTVLEAFEVLLAGQTHALYDVRRIISSRKGDSAAAGSVDRSLRIRTTGTREDLQAQLDRFAADGAAKGLTTSVIGEDRLTRLYQHQRGTLFPTIERFFVVAPALAAPKEKSRFNERWAELAG